MLNSLLVNLCAVTAYPIGGDHASRSRLPNGFQYYPGRLCSCLIVGWTRPRAYAEKIR